MKREEKIFYAVLSICTLWLAYIIFSADATFDKGDGIQHYLISRYSWTHSELFLHHWGKPFFILLSSPFSQFGIIGTSIFNLLCAALSAWCAYKIANRFEIKLAWTIPILLFFSTIYFAVINSGLTEPLFGLVLIAGIYLFIEKKFIFSALLISFLPFVRSEGFMLLPLFGAMLLYRKKFTAIPLLAAGTFIYSIIGGIALKDFLWIWTQNPYKGAYNVYGHGELLHFIKQYNQIWGGILFVLFGAGCLLFLIQLWKRKKEIPLLRFVYGKPNDSLLMEELVLIYGCFGIYFLAHTFFWWKGIYSSLGLVRVIAGVMPLSALICLRAIAGISEVFDWNKVLRIIVLSVVLLLVIKAPFFQWYFPFQLEGEERVAVEVGKWFEHSEYKNNTLYYLQPYLTIALNIDPFDKKRVTELWWLNEDIKNNAVPKTAIIFWDTHYGPNECKLKPELFDDTTKFKLLKRFLPYKIFKTLGGYDYEIRVYETK